MDRQAEEEGAPVLGADRGQRCEVPPGRREPDGPPSGRSKWRLSGGHVALEVRGGGEDAARALVNLVCLQGPGAVAVDPWGRVDELRDGLHRIDPHGRFSAWWAGIAGTPLELVADPPPVLPIPYHRLARGFPASGLLVGVNVGGGHLRVVHVRDGSVTTERSIPLRARGRGLLSGARLADFAELVRIGLPGVPDRVGVAWSAPRIGGRLHPESLATSDTGELREAMQAGDLDARLSAVLGCPVSSWHDGEAAAAGELVAAPDGESGELLALKLGTSVGAGLATSQGVCALPLQVSKSLVGPITPEGLPHPLVGLRGAVRSTVGAQALGQLFTGRPEPAWDDFGRFCAALGHRQSRAVGLAARAAKVLEGVAGLVREVWPTARVILTGKNLECAALRDELLRNLSASVLSSQAGPGGRFGVLDPDFASALGAVALAWSAEDRPVTTP
jgi:predicted NBD/HSP70 family sugar kinase